MNVDVESMRYTDEQALKPADHCPVCGGERYRPGLRCIRCEGGIV